MKNYFDRSIVTINKTIDKTIDKTIVKTIAKKIPHAARLLVPVILGTILICIIVTVMFFGGKRESLVAQTESIFINMALNSALNRSNSSQAPDSTLSTRSIQSRVVAVSVTDSDIWSLRRAPESNLIDAHISEYANVVEHLSGSNPDWIVVSWLSYAHPLTPEYLKPLTDVIDRLNLFDRLTIAVNLNAAGTLSNDFLKRYHIVEARDCYYEVNLFCAISPEWSWMPQQIFNRFFTNPPQWHVSTNLPHTMPSVLLNLPAPSSIYRRSFLDFKPPVTADIPDHAIVFIGNDVSQNLVFRNNKDALQRTYAASSTVRRSLLKDGIPWHIFWASMTTMLLDKSTIAVVPLSLCILVMILTSIAIITSIRYFGRAAVGPCFVAAIGLPFANRIGVQSFGVYLPIAPIFLVGIVLFTSAIFAAVAYSSYTKWRLLASEDLAESTADIKQNFIHLISHNLNTPLAQLRGLIDILSLTEIQSSQLPVASELLEYIRITVRCVLDTTTLLNQPVHAAEHPIKAFIFEFLDQEESLFRRMGRQVTVSYSSTDSDDNDIMSIGGNFDRVMIHASLLYATALVGIKSDAKDILISISVEKNDSTQFKKLRFEIVNGSVAGNEMRKFSQNAFICKALDRFIKIAASKQMIEVENHEQGIVIMTVATL